MVLLQGLVLTGLVIYQDIALDPLMFIAFAAIALKLLLVFAIILFFSTFSSPLLSILFTLGIYISAHSISGVMDIALRSQQIVMVYMAKVFMTIFPQFEALNMAKNTLGTPVDLPFSFFLINFGTALAYLLLILVATSIIFKYKKFENA